MISLFLTLMLSSLSHKDPEIRERAAATVLYHVAENDENKETIAAAGAIPPLVNLLKDSEPLVKQNAAGALWHLAVNVSNRVRIKSEVSSHKDKELIILNLSSLVAENGWVKGLFDLINS